MRAVSGGVEDEVCSVLMAYLDRDGRRVAGFNRQSRDSAQWACLLRERLDDADED